MDSNLKLHEEYKRNDVAEAFGEKGGPGGKWVSGVVPVGENSIALFITLNKKDFALRHRYEDRFQSKKILQWQSQNKARPDKGIGKKHIEADQETNPHHVFVRREKGEQFTYCGKVKYIRHEGSKPITIWWELVQPISDELYKKFTKVTD